MASTPTEPLRRDGWARLRACPGRCSELVLCSVHPLPIPHLDPLDTLDTSIHWIPIRKHGHGNTTLGSLPTPVPPSSCRQSESEFLSAVRIGISAINRRYAYSARGQSRFRRAKGSKTRQP